MRIVDCDVRFAHCYRYSTGVRNMTEESFQSAKWRRILIVHRSELTSENFHEDAGSSEVSDFVLIISSIHISNKSSEIQGHPEHRRVFNISSASKGEELAENRIGIKGSTLELYSLSSIEWALSRTLLLTSCEIPSILIRVFKSWA